MSGIEIPADLVPVGHIAGAFGIRGELRIRPYSDSADALLNVRRWWLDKPEMTDVEAANARWQGEDVVAGIVGVTDRNTAEALKGAVVHVRRSHFPALGENEYYWIDLIGCRVTNLSGEALGKLVGLMDSGAHPILQVMPEGPAPDVREILIPFVDRFVKTVDQGAKTITVDWEKDF